MSNIQLVDVSGWEWDLHSIYTAYLGYFENRNIPWWNQSYGYLFKTFDDFLSFGWPVIVVTDSWTRKPHIVTRISTLNAFLKSIKTRYGETLPTLNSAVQIVTFETQQRPQWIVSDMKSYARLHATLPGAVLSALKARVKSGEPSTIQELWDSKQYTFLAIDFEWSERNKSQCLEFGYAAMRTFYLNAARGTWPPNPVEHYRRGHFIVEEYANIPHKKRTAVVPWEYTWGESQVIPKARLSEVVQSILSSLAAPDSETTANEMILVGHGISGDLERLADLKIKLPRNCICIDTAIFERQLFVTGMRGKMVDPSGKLRPQGTMLSLEKVIQSFGLPIPCTLHNAGNDAFVCLWALQLLLDGPGKVKTPTPQVPVTVATPILLAPPIVRNHTDSLDKPSGNKFRPGSLLSVQKRKTQRRTSAPDLDEHGALRGKGQS